MILILSDFLDQSTNDLMDWAKFYKQETFIITDQDTVNLIELDINNLKFKLWVNGVILESSKIKYFIYRKGNINLTHEILEENHLNNNYEQYFSEELTVAKDFIVYTLQKVTKKYIGDYFHRSPNKLFYLSIAQSVGLDIPNTYVTSNKKLVEKFSEQHEHSLITKAISESYGEVSNGLMHYSYTSAVGENEITTAADNFFPSLLQNRIKKVVELRVFFVRNVFFPMAMFYSNTETDYRDDYNKIQRMSPFKLPTYIEAKLNSFIEKTGLTTGSFDLMLDDEERFFFLEVNPNGQFGFVSDSCNYHIEKRIIEILINA